MTGALVSFEPKYAERMSCVFKKGEINMIPEEFISPLTEDGFLVEANFDEHKKINDLAQRRINWTKSWHFSIMLNQSCNFKCFYCFQPRKKLFITPAVEEKIIKLIKLQCKKTDRISIDWYGGEPLLSVDLFKKMNTKIHGICMAKNVDYEISLTTNGYLLNETVLEYLSSYKVSHFQITLDAPAEYHDKSRVLKNGTPTFEVILANIQNVVSRGVHVLVRVNVTEHNKDSSFEIYDLLERAGLKNKVEVSIRPVVSSAANPCAGGCLTQTDFGEKMLSHYYEAAKNGWVILPFVDSLQSMGYCIADYPTQAIIDPKGNLYKCGEAFSEEEATGLINDSGEIVWDEAKYNAFVNRNPLHQKECRNCEILPICMGGCHMLRFWKNKKSCNEFKHDLDQFVKILRLNEINMGNANS
ncbi:SPASM domain-containing protein [Patescibacteria group bacterium]|nr:SPASM domain-containing protein [Patescibacteria group bacterium]